MLQYKKTIKTTLILFLLLGAAQWMPIPASASNHIPAGCPGGPSGPVAPGVDCGEYSDQSNCVEIGVSVPGVEDNCIEKGAGDDNPIFVYLKGIIRFLATGVGIAVTISLVVGGIQYMSSRGNPQATQAAVNRITNAVIALVLFILMAAILNFLIPGGLL